MRNKEDAHDYRYFPEPDLMPVRISKELLDSIKSELIEMPFDRQRRYMNDYSLPYSAASVICHDRALCEYFEKSLKSYDKNPKTTANMLVNDLLREISASETSEDEGELVSSFGEEEQRQQVVKKQLDDSCKLTPENLAGLVKIIDEGTISKQIAKDVFVEMFNTGKTAEAIVEEKALKQNSDSDELEKFCQAAIDANPKAVSEFKAGNEKAINALIGPVMKASKGKANPGMLLGILKKLIK